MTLMQRVAGSPEVTQVASGTRAYLMGEEGYTLRHCYGVGDKCPMCSARLQRQEWGKAFAATIGLNVCGCGYVSQQFSIA